MGRTFIGSALLGGKEGKVDTDEGKGREEEHDGSRDTDATHFLGVVEVDDRLAVGDGAGSVFAELVGTAKDEALELVDEEDGKGVAHKADVGEPADADPDGGRLEEKAAGEDGAGGCGVGGLGVAGGGIERKPGPGAKDGEE